MSIRKGMEKDAAVITEYNYCLAKETEDKELDLEVLGKGVSAVLSDDTKGVYYVYEEDGKVVGQLMCTYEWSDWRNGTFLWVQSVYVHKEYRNKGIFKALYNHVKEICDTQEGYAGIRLYVETENHGAQRTYESLGMDKCQYWMYEYEKVHTI